MEKMSKAPVVLFVYNRPWHTEQCLESLSKCEGAGESELYVYSDGPKRPEDKEAVEKVRELVKSRNWCKEVHVTESRCGINSDVDRIQRVGVVEPLGKSGGGR